MAWNEALNERQLQNANAHELVGDNSDNVLTGTSAAETIDGRGGNDAIDGRGGGDRLIGGTGNDRFYINDANDVVVERSGEGTDRVFANVSYTLPADAHVELFSTDFNPGTAAINLTGNSFSQAIYGNAGPNVLRGGGGSDTLVGFEGDDQYFVDGPGDRVLEASGGGNDRVFASASYALGTGQHIELLSTDDNFGSAPINLTGNSFDNSIFGNEGNNVLTGGGGNDSLNGFGGNDRLIGGRTLSGGSGDDTLIDGEVMRGGPGDDLYVTGANSPEIVELPGEGYDRVLASGSFQVRNGVSVEVIEAADRSGKASVELYGNDQSQSILGDASDNFIFGYNGDDSLYGFDGDDHLNAGAGDDFLDGGAGKNYLQGGAGNDRYIIRSLLDRVWESVGQGTSDRVLSSINYVLADGNDIELLTTTDNVGTLSIALTGNRGNQSIFGNAGSNTLDGGGGTDSLSGFAGDDLFYVDAGDSVFEAADGGTDRVFARTSFQLTAGAHVELLTTSLNSGTSAIDLTGNALAQSIFGNAGRNILDGKEGRDSLTGFEGTDVFAFSTALSASNVDYISDFVSGLDRVQLSRTVFSALSAGPLESGAFRVGMAATDANDRIVYDPATGRIFYDVDGSGAAAAVEFAVLRPGTTLAATDFLVV